MTTQNKKPRTEQDDRKRDVGRAAYVAPSILTLDATPENLARYGLQVSGDHDNSLGRDRHPKAVEHQSED